jgi:rSAM/selenodomain-associated transferase 1
MRRVRIIVFSKAPRPGFAKARLIPALGQEGSAGLAHAMLSYTLSESLAAGIGKVELCVTPSIGDVSWRGFSMPDGILITDQGEGDLGDRLARAAHRSLKQGESVLLIGTDCVEMSADLLCNAVRMLSEYDAVMHCTSDGGYALLGLNRFSPTLFAGIPWSTDAVAFTTLGKIGQMGWAVHVGRLLHDIDEPRDLKHLPTIMNNFQRDCKKFPDCSTNECRLTLNRDLLCTILSRIITENNLAAPMI